MFKKIFRNNFRIYGADFETQKEERGTLWAIDIHGGERTYLGSFSDDEVSIASNLYSQEWDIYRSAEKLFKIIQTKSGPSKRPSPDIDGIRQFKEYRAQGMSYRQIKNIMGKDLKTLARWNKHDLSAYKCDFTFKKPDKKLKVLSEIFPWFFVLMLINRAVRLIHGLKYGHFIE